MRFRTSIEITLKTTAGSHELSPGGIFKAGRSEYIINLLAEGRFEAVLDIDHANADEILELASNFRNENRALKIFSQLFDEAFYCASAWVSFKSGLRKKELGIYTFDELKILLSADKEEQKIIHKAKYIFNGTLIKEVRIEPGANLRELRQLVPRA